jgi:hypothetical protein
LRASLSLVDRKDALLDFQDRLASNQLPGDPLSERIGGWLVFLPRRVALPLAA